ncbi:uncharacterized protein [Malus domestica]|uniref:uncharacterized protein n=1 Tax=Malus domestica TaxID=3750 RepID=UPI003974AC87
MEALEFHCRQKTLVGTLRTRSPQERISERRGVGIGGKFRIRIGGDQMSIHCGVLRSRSFMVYTTRQSLRKVNDEQKTGIRKTEHDLQVAKEEMVKEKFGISSIFEDLTEVHGGWLPHTFGVHVDYFQTYIVTYWNELGRPAFNLGIEKALKMKAHGEDWAGIIVERIRTVCYPKLFFI